MEEVDKTIGLINQIETHTRLINRLIRYIEALEQDIIASGTARAEDLAALYQQILRSDDDAADTEESE